MGILDKYARTPRENGNRTKPATTKLTDREYDLFKKYCDERRLSVSEGIRYLILEEMESKPKAVQVDKSKPKPRKRGYRGFRIDQYANEDGTVDCPECGSNISKSNFSRHAKTQHGKTTKELFEGRE